MITITVRRRPGPLFVRFPSWAPANIRVTCNDDGVVDVTTSHTDGYLMIATPPIDQLLCFAFGLPEHQITLRHRAHEIKVAMRGDAVVAMQSFGADLTFFPPL